MQVAEMLEEQVHVAALWCNDGGTMAMMISGGVLGACGRNDFLVSGCMC